ncbi:MAG TPA: phosphoribosylanthranilate isomerase [Bryobacteraceae bacterium]|jgi:phosphoribosylanthranilate isomerase
MVLKICGITCPEDAAAAVEGGATAIGFNFWPRSPRYIAPEQAAHIVSREGIRRVGVFVNEVPARIAEIARLVHLDVAQLHGDEAPAAYPTGLVVWKGARVAAGFDFSAYDDSPAEALVLDGPAGALYGGSGQTFDWGLVAAVRKRIILAGGLDASNVARAIAAAHPWGVDACSRLESAPGKKDYRKMNEFLQAARAALLA